MKKLFASVLMASMVALSLPSVAAASGNANYDNIVIGSDLVLNYNGNNRNPLKSFVRDMMSELVNKDLDTVTLEDMETLKLLDEIFLSNNLSLVLADTDTELFYGMAEMSQGTFNDVINKMEKFEKMQTSSLGNSTIYSSYKRDDFAFTYYNGSFLFSDTVSNLSEIVAKLNSGKASFSYLTDEIPGDSFMSLLLPKDSGLLDMAGMDIIESDVISITETSEDHFELIEHMTGDQNLYNTHNFSYDFFSATPSLYKSMPGENSAFYIEMNDIAGLIQKAQAMASKDGLANVLEIPAPYDSLLSGKSALGLNFYSKNVVPSITFLAENNDSSVTESLNTELSSMAADYADSTNSQSGLNTYRVKSSEFGSNTNKYPELKNVGLAFGQVGDLYVISTDTTIEGKMSGNNTLAQNGRFMNVLSSALNRDVVILGYMDLSSIGQYADYVKSKEKNTMSSEETEVYNTSMDLIKNLDPWSVYSYGSANKLNVNYSMHLPISKFTELVVDTMDYSNSDTSFSDVDMNNAWYSKDLTNTYKDGIVRGSNGKFNPDAQITRAEFITMLVRHYDLEYSSAPLGSSVFTDVPYGSWYDADMGIAYNHGLIQGDQNGKTMRPNAPISRAEAVQILKNYSGVLYEAELIELPFNDVSQDDWYFEAVSSAYGKEIVKGATKNSFQPARPLNRAEAVALINRIRNREFRFF